MKKYVCSICGYVYDESTGIPDAGIAPGTKWEELPEQWVCPLCGASKAEFKLQEEKKETVLPVKMEKQEKQEKQEEQEEQEEIKELNLAQMSALCSNLAKGCEKQYLQEETALFLQLAEYYKGKAGKEEGKDFQELVNKINENLEHDYVHANGAANVTPDRGALRALVWSEKVTRILNSLLERYEKEKDSMLEHTSIYVCEICGFIWIGDTLPAICPVCKVPNKKFTKIERR
ncbi:MAG: rubredoxin [Lachnospiraceae bacterium]